VAFSNTSAGGAVNFHDAAPDTITLGGSALEITSEVRVDGPGAEKLSIDGDAKSRVFTIDPGSAEVSLAGLTITKGAAVAAPEFNGGGIVFRGDGILTIEGCRVTGNQCGFGGGGIRHEGSGTLRVVASKITNNYAGYGGGGLFNSNGALEVIDSIVSGNHSDLLGGGIYSNQGATVKSSTIAENTSGAFGGGILANLGDFHIINSTIALNESATRGGGIASHLFNVVRVDLVNCTVAGNEAVQEGGGIYVANTGFELTARNTIVALNTAPASADVLLLYNNPFSQTLSLIGVDPGLKVDGLGKPVLDLNGGATPTIALLAGSPAIDAGDNALAVDENSAPLANDQRGLGFTRIAKGSGGLSTAIVDIGAYELFAAPVFAEDDLSISGGGAPVNLASATGASPAGGVFSGPGVSGGLFDPRTQVPGIYTLTYTVTDAFGVTNSANFTVTVEALPPALTLTKLKRFKTTLVGSSSRAQRVIVSNVGGLPTKTLRVQVSGPAKKDFVVTQPAVRSLEAGASTFFQVTFRPRKDGTRKAVVTVESDSTPVSVNLQGRGKSKSGIRPPRAVKK